MSVKCGLRTDEMREPPTPCEFCKEPGVTAWGRTFCFRCMDKALALLKRVESGESVEIRKRDGKFPSVSLLTGYVLIGNSKHVATGKDIPAAAQKWNGAV